jgi:hypothetical protein
MTGPKGGAPGAIQQARQELIAENERALPQWEAQLAKLEKYQEDADELQKDIATSERRIMLCKEAIEDNKARNLADERLAIEVKAEELVAAKKAKTPKKSAPAPNEDEDDE